MSSWLALISGRGGAEDLGLDSSYPDVGELLPVVVVCVISILLTGLWLLAVWEYVGLRGKRGGEV